MRATAAWLHIAVAEEKLTSLAEWFAGDAARAADLERENVFPGGVVPPGATVRIPAELLVPPFRDAEPVPETEPPNLVFGADAKGRYAVYRLRKGEALYSAVVVRFTGRLDAADVNELALKLAERSGIADVHAIPVGYPVKIPLDVLSDEFLPKDDARLRGEGAREGRDGAVLEARGRARPRGRARDPRRRARRPRHGDAPRRRLGGDVRLRRRLPAPEDPPRAAPVPRSS